MLELDFSINGQIITRNDEKPIVRDSQNYVYALFLGDEEWRSHGTVTAIFKGADGQIFNMILSYDSHYGHSCLVPWEVLTQPWFEVSAFCGNLITANTVKVFTIKSGYDSSRDSRIPTPDVYNQIIEKINESEVTITPTLQSGTKIADITKGGTTKPLYAPTGGGGGTTPIISASATVDGNTGTPSVTVTKSGTDEAPSFAFDFSNLKGETGSQGPTGPQGPQGPQGEAGEDGSVVIVTQTLSSGTEIAEIDVDGTKTKLYAPSGGGSASSLSDLSDTSISSPSSGDALVYDGEKWENGKVDSDNVAIHDSYKLIYDINHVTIPSTYASEMSLVDGVLTVHAPESGNHWPKYMIYDADIISQGATSCTIKINVESITQGATWRIAFIYGKTDGTQVFKYPADITRSGEYTVLWDIQYETVYNLYDGNGLTIGIVNSQTFGSDKEIVINSFNANIGNAEQPIEGDNVTEALIILDNKIEEVTTNKNNIVLTAPDGSKYAVLVDSTGSLTTSPVLPSNILYIGNSLLIGFGTHGMASTTINDDYFAKVNAYLTDAGKTLTTDKLSSGNMESATTDSAVQTWISESLAPKLSNSTELVIVCAGDNANTTEKRLEFQKGCGMVMSYIREHAPHARIAWLSTWYGSTGNNQTIQAACAKYGATYVYISDLRSNPDNHSYIGATYFDSNGNEQTVTAEGVASHPSDQGFEIIADRIIKAMFE